MLKRLIVLLLLLLLPNAINAQRIGEKTNLLYWTTTSPNIGIEIAWHKKWTVDLFAGYNPWEFSDDASLRHWLVKVEPRWWVCQPFGGHFFGLHGIYAKYNVGNIPFIKKLEEYTLRGDAYGAGVSYGYHFVLGGRWGFAVTAKTLLAVINERILDRHK
jgi:hypothetical protein